MKKNKVHIENYESYYLDYLENNLGEDEILDLFSFLNHHPHLKVDEELPTLQPIEKGLDQEFRNVLKMGGFPYKISRNNIDLFLLAKLENQLNESQEKALEQFLMRNPEYNAEDKLYAATVLKADESIVYPNKSGLKRKGKVILWPYFSSAAAACAVLFFWLLSDNANGLRPISAAKENKQVESIETTFTQTTNNPLAVKSTSSNVQTKQRSSFEKIGAEPIYLKENTAELTVVPNQVKSDVPNKMKVQYMEDQKLEKITLAQNQAKGKEKMYTPTAENNHAYAMAMKDFAQPVTKKIAELIKTEVDLKKDKDLNTKRERFFFKLGSFEFYRNRKVKE